MYFISVEGEMLFERGGYTKKIEDIRMCFIELEKIANKYKHYIIEHN